MQLAGLVAPKASGILPDQGLNPRSPGLAGTFLTARPPGKSPNLICYVVFPEPRTLPDNQNVVIRVYLMSKEPNDVKEHKRCPSQCTEQNFWVV